MTPTEAGRAPLLVLGDALLDRDVDGVSERLAPDAPAPVVDERTAVARPGGAALAAVLAARDGRDVTLVTALGDDAAGRELRALLDRVGVAVVDVGLRGATPEKIRIRVDGRPLVRLDRGGGRPRRPAGAVAERVGAAEAVLVADYGRGMSGLAPLRDALAARPAHAPLVWDPHPKGSAPVAGATVVTPNRDEARRFAAAAPAPPEGDGEAAVARTLLRAWSAAHVCVTLGARGALLTGPVAAPLVVPAGPVAAGDPCGAGDRFAATLAGRLADGELPSGAVREAVAAATAFVAAGGAGAVRVAPVVGPAWPASSGAPGGPGAGAGGAPRASGATGGDAVALARRVRAAGGRVVATGGCFDLLHVGHLSLLDSARRLGDVLIVVLNSDASVARLKGPDRPVNSQDERAALLAGLRAVDGVVVFEEDTPVRALERVRPHLWVKGGDYLGMGLPEEAALRRWGGEVVLVPFVAGRSTSRLLEEARSRGG